MAKLGVQKLAQDGVRSLNSYFMYSLVAVLLGFIMILFAAPLLGSNAAGASSAGAGLSLILILLIAVVAVVFDIYGLLSLMFGLRDIRRSSLKHASNYSTISCQLKYIVISLVVVEIIVVALSMVNAITTLQSTLYGMAPTPSPIPLVLMAFIILDMALLILWTWELSKTYKFLSSDLSQKPLYSAGNLLLAGMAIIVLAALAGVIIKPASGIATIQGAAGAAVLLLELVGLALYAASFYMGYKGTKAALR